MPTPSDAPLKEQTPNATQLNLVEGASAASHFAVDVGGGAGRLTFPVSPWVLEIGAVEILADAAARSGSAADISRLTNARFVLGDAKPAD